MTDLEALIDRLLFEEESSALDFKREQYRFTGATVEDKSALLKDILAFANSWRRTDAYILVGVEEVCGGRSRPVGITADLDDANLQQFVNSKTQRPIDFSYRAVGFQGVKIGLFRIPVQQGPFFLKKDYGKLKMHSVYLRRSTSTEIAAPDEIAEMGKAHSALSAAGPQLAVSLAKGRLREAIGTSWQFEVRVLRTPPEAAIPDFRGEGAGFVRGVDRVNSDYYRDLVRYVRFMEETAPIYLMVENGGDRVARDVRVQLKARRNAGLILRDSSSLPRLPQRSFSMVDYQLSSRAVTDFARDVSVERRGSSLYVDASLGKVQPGDTASTGDKLYVGATKSDVHLIEGQIFSDDLPAPTEFTLRFDIQVFVQDADLEEIEIIDAKRLTQSEEYQEYIDSLGDS